MVFGRYSRYIDILTNWFINQLITIDISPITIDISPKNHSYYGVYKPTFTSLRGLHILATKRHDTGDGP